MADSNIKEALESVVGYIGEEVNTKLETKQDVFKVSEMDEATSSNVGSIVQYIGTSIPDSYQHNYFYECKAQGTEPETYAWEQVNVQPSSEGDERVKPEITEIAVEYDTTQNPRYVAYIEVDPLEVMGSNPTADDLVYAKKMLDDGDITQAEFMDIFNASTSTFADMPLDVIAVVADAYYDGDLSLNDIKNIWSIGDTKTFTLSAMSAETVREAHAEQTCTMRIVDFNHDALTEADGSITNALLTFAFLISESGSMKNSGSDSGGSSTGNTGGWKSSERRTWCNNTCVNALPLEIQNLLKAVDKTYDIGGASETTAVTSDKLFIPSAIELTNGAADSDWNTTLWTSIRAGGGGGTQYEYYKTHNLPVSKNICTSTTVGAHYSNGYNYYNSYWVSATSSKGRYHFRGDSAQGLLIHGCI